MRRLVVMGGVVLLALGAGSGVATATPQVQVAPVPPGCAPDDAHPGRLLPDPPRAADPTDPADVLPVDPSDRGADPAAPTGQGELPGDPADSGVLPADGSDPGDGNDPGDATDPADTDPAGATEPADATDPADATGTAPADGTDPAEPTGRNAPPAVDPCPPADRTPTEQQPDPDTPRPTDPAPPPAGGGGQVSAGHDTSAAARHNWGEPSRVEEFDGPLDDSWSVYDGPGHAGKGRRTPDAVTVADGELAITGTSKGHTAGMAWQPGQKYGRWEGRVRAPASDPSYNALLLLWPTAENFPVGGEIDFMEMTDHTRQSTNLFLHYGPNNDQVHGEVDADGTVWNNWAVEWTPTHVAAFLNGEEWWRTTNTKILPPGPMHLCIQLDWFPKGGSVRESSMHVDWVKQYPLRPDEIVDAATESIDERVDGALRAAADRVGTAEGGPDPAPARPVLPAPGATPSGSAQRAPSVIR